MSNINATREQIIAALHAGHSVYRINRELRADKARIRAIRNELGLDVYVRPEQTHTIEDKWRLFVRALDGGHMEWTGERGKASGTPLLSFKEKHHSATAVAFRIRTGRDPEGYALPECGMKQCVAPEHVEDEPGRLRLREQLRYLNGGRPIPERCSNGHARSEHGRIGPDGHAYCNTCKRARERQAAA